MTTPERLKRRQMIEGSLLVVIGIALLVQALYFQAKAADQRECLTTNFQELSVALDARGDLTQKETAQNKALWLIYARAAGLLKDPKGELTQKQQQRFQVELVDQLAEYQRVIKKIEEERKEHPLPPYPLGVCQ